VESGYWLFSRAIIDKETVMANFAMAVTDTEFEQNVLGSEKPVLVDFWAEWCGPCRMIAPSVEAVAEQYEGKAGFFKMNVDENMNVPQQYGIRGIPTLIVFKGGQEQERIVGAVTREAIAKVVEKYVDDTSTSASGTGT
jgi:thioredoxin 1